MLGTSMTASFNRQALETDMPIPQSSLAESKTRGFLNTLPADYDVGQSSYTSDLSQTRKLETQRKWASEKVDRLTREVIMMEERMQIQKRWDPSMPEYLETIQYMANRKYHKALDHLQHLVVQRLFELQRLNVSGIGESSHYSGLQTRTPVESNMNFNAGRLSGSYTTI